MTCRKSLAAVVALAGAAATSATSGAVINPGTGSPNRLLYVAPAL